MRRKDREITETEEIRGIIDKCKVCHLAMTDEGRPYVVPLNFGYILENGVLTLYFHSAKEGRKIDILRETHDVCFDMACEGKLAFFENACNSGYYFESVLGFGKVYFVEDVKEKCEALSLIVKHQANRDIAFTEKQAESVCVFKAVSSDFTGKKKPEPKNQG